MKLTKLANLIYEVLEQNEEARNDDDVLCFEVWNKLAPVDNIWTIPVGDFHHILKRQWKLPNEQSIRRTRRKVQEHYPETRGTKYNNRKARQEKVKSNLRLVAAESTNLNY
jgi:hypothetical protein